MQALNIVATLGEEEQVISHHSSILQRKIGHENLLLGKTKLSMEFNEKSLALAQDGYVCCLLFVTISIHFIT